MDTGLIVVITLQGIEMLNRNAVYLKLISCQMATILQKKKRAQESSQYFLTKLINHFPEENGTSPEK